MRGWLVAALAATASASLVACDSDTSLAPAGGSTTPPPIAQGNPCGGGLPLPTDQYFVPNGMCATLIATKTPILRQLAFASSSCGPCTLRSRVRTESRRTGLTVSTA